MTTPPPEGGHVGVNRPIEGTQWEPQQADLVELPRYPTLDAEAYGRGVLLLTKAGQPSHWLIWQPTTGALGWTRPAEANWWDPEVRALEAELVRAMALGSIQGVLPGVLFDRLTGGREWEAVRLVDLWG